MSAPPKEFVDAWLKTTQWEEQDDFCKRDKLCDYCVELLRDAWNADDEDGSIWRAATAAAHEADARLLKTYVVCSCAPYWTDRQMHAPECSKEEVEDAIAAIRSRTEEAKK